jgi:uncharacterized protein (DUF4213/DUF364 family)
MGILPELLAGLTAYPVVDVRIGIHWVAVVTEVAGSLQAGLAATLHENHTHTRTPDIPEAGLLQKKSSTELAGWVLENHPLRASVGLAAINASLEIPAGLREDSNAEAVIASRGRDSRVVLVGHFPFVPELRARVGELVVLEQNPQAGDLPASSAPQVLPTADVVAITSMTLSNHTLEGLLEYCNPRAFTMLLGPSTPLHPVLFEHGVDWLSGAITLRVETVLRAVSQGANFHQLKQAGVRLVNLARPEVEVQEK